MDNKVKRGFKRKTIEEFAKPDSSIVGLIATDILTRGFDVADVKIGISARPFSKSFGSHVQQMGRIMRSHPSKEFGVWLDHSGNYLRFRDDWDEVYEEGVKKLDEKDIFFKDDDVGVVFTELLNLLKYLNDLSITARYNLFLAAKEIVEHNWNHFYNGGFEKILWKELQDTLNGIKPSR